MKMIIMFNYTMSKNKNARTTIQILQQYHTKTARDELIPNEIKYKILAKIIHNANK
jgi:hypothetical protein